MLGELSQEIPVVSGRRRAEGVVLGIFNVSRPNPYVVGGGSFPIVEHNSLTIFVEVLDDAEEVIEKKLFAVRSAGEWDGDLYVIVDHFHFTSIGSGGSSIFNYAVEARVELAGNVRFPGAFFQDNYPIDRGTSSSFYQLRGTSAQCRISPLAPMASQGNPDPPSPKLAVFRNPTMETKRWFVRSRSFYQQNWVVPLEELQLAPSGDNTVSGSDATAQFPLGTVYTGDQHPEISITGTRRARFTHHSERVPIEPFYFLADLRGGKSIRITQREFRDNMTGDPVLTNEYPADGSARSDETTASTTSFTVETRFYRIM